MKTDDDDDVFDLDLTSFDEEAHEATALIDELRDEERLAQLLEPFGSEPEYKARELLTHNLVRLVSQVDQVKVYEVKGSRLYKVTITSGADFTFVQCTCPNGTARGGDANCYHSIGARVLDAGLLRAWDIEVPNA